jgi:hypothetical protein
LCHELQHAHGCLLSTHDNDANSGNAGMFLTASCTEPNRVM